MNTWLKVALYTFAAIIVGSLLIGMLTSNSTATIGSIGGWNMPRYTYGQGNMMATGQNAGLQNGIGLYGNGMCGGMGMQRR